jgi:hypothetical protein
MQSLSAHTEVLTYLGGMKKASSLVRGDILLGDDCQPRIVHSVTIKPSAQLFTVTPETAFPYSVGPDHILLLYSDLYRKTISITIADYNKQILLDPSTYSSYLLYSIPIEYNDQPIRNDPFIVGIILGGNEKTIEDVMKEYLIQKLAALDQFISKSIGSLSVNTIDKEEIIDLMSNRYVPTIYLYNTKEIRLKFLKGFISSSKAREIQMHTYRARSSERSPHSARSSDDKISSGRSTRSKSGSQTPVESSHIRSKSQSGLSRTFSDKLDDKISSGRWRGGKSPVRTPITKSPVRSPYTPSRSKSPNALRKSTSMQYDIRKSYVNKPISPVNRSRDRSSKPVSGVRSSINLDSNETRIIESNYENSYDDVKTAEVKPTKLALFKSRIPVLKKDEEITIKIYDSILAQQIKFLLKTLGLVSIYLHPELTIYGNLDRLPPMNEKKLTSFKISNAEIGDSVSFVLDGNGRYILANCIVSKI